MILKYIEIVRKILQRQRQTSAVMQNAAIYISVRSKLIAI